MLDFLLAEMENNVGKIIFIVAGYKREMEDFFEHNPGTCWPFGTLFLANGSNGGIPSRIPYSLLFEDYTDQELLHMFVAYVDKKYHGSMRYDGGNTGLFVRIAIRRLGRGRGRPGFGNARAMQNMFQRIADRQSFRLREERASGRVADDFILVCEDLIGPDPSLAIGKSDSWAKLKGMIGLASVKQSVQDLVDMIGTNYRRELEEKEPLQVTLNRVFYGNPGLFLVAVTSRRFDDEKQVPAKRRWLSSMAKYWRISACSAMAKVYIALESLHHEH